MISKKFFKSSIVYSVVGALPMLSGFILLPFYTGDILSEKNYGYLTLHLTFSLLFQSIFIFCLESFVGPVIIETKQDTAKLKQKLAAINYYSLLIAASGILILLVTGPFLFEQAFEDSAPMRFYPFMCFTVFTSFFNAYFKLYCNQLIYTEQASRYLVANVINFITTLMISITALYWCGDSIMGPLIGRLASGIIIFLISIAYLNKQYGCKADPIFLKEIKKFCFPLLLFSILSWMFNNIDRLFIEKMLSTELVGLFDFGIKCTLGIEIIFGGMNNAIYPKIYDMIKKNETTLYLKEHINKYASGYLIVIILAIVFTLLTVPFAVNLFIKKIFFHKSLSFLAILTIGQIFKVLYFIYLAPLFYYKRTDLVAKSFVFATIVQIIITYILIIFLGFNGIIISYIVSKPFQILFVYRESRRLVYIPINIMKQIVLPIFLCIIVFSLQLIIKDNQVMYYNPMVGCIILLVTIFFYRNEI
ncbi:MAG: lipopolysaccharide biosynthesis protein, partial [Bacteroidia bacterium]|nr:lipopolysaccharide biosynthesis protein [Bacteroidia bacterium]